MLGPATRILMLLAIAGLCFVGATPQAGAQGRSGGDCIFCYNVCDRHYSGRDLLRCRSDCNRDRCIQANKSGCNRGWQHTAKGCKCIKPLRKGGVCPL